MDKSSREEKLNVELVSDHFRKRIVPSERLSINFRRARTPVTAGPKYFFVGEMCRHAWHFLFTRAGESAVSLPRASRNEILDL